MLVWFTVEAIIEVLRGINLICLYRASSPIFPPRWSDISLCLWMLQRRIYYTHLYCQLNESISCLFLMEKTRCASEWSANLNKIIQVVFYKLKGKSIQVYSSVLTCIPSNSQQEGTPLVAKRSHVGLWENDTTSHLIYYLSNQFLNVFMVSISTLKSSSTKHNVNFVD